MSYLEYVTVEQESYEPLEALARANDFNLDDLDANRRGKITLEQRRKLVGKALQPLRYTGGALAGWLLCCFVVKTLVPSIVLMIAGMLGAKGIGILFGVVTASAAGAFILSVIRCSR